MSVTDSILRFNLIIQKLRKKPSSLLEIQDYLARESHIQERSFVRDKRTFKRDCESISDIYKINIEFDANRKVYELVNDDLSSAHTRMLEAFDTLNALNLSERMSKVVNFETHRGTGTEHLYDLICACKEKKEVHFDYQKFDQTKPYTRSVHAFGLKEFKKRWYLVSRDLTDEHIKIFALDRMTNVRLQPKKFTETYSVADHFKNSFGIISPNGLKCEEIVLAFEPYQAHYLKGIPLHTSQEIVTDNENEFIIKLNLIPTFDFKMEILKYGSLVRVIEPLFLKEEIKMEIDRASRQYLP